MVVILYFVKRDSISIFSTVVFCCASIHISMCIVEMLHIEWSLSRTLFREIPSPYFQLQFVALSNYLFCCASIHISMCIVEMLHVEWSLSRTLFREIPSPNFQLQFVALSNYLSCYASIHISVYNRKRIKFTLFCIKIIHMSLCIIV